MTHEIAHDRDSTDAIERNPVRPRLEINEGEALLKRVANPDIFGQIVDMLSADEERRHTEEIGRGSRGPDGAWLKDSDGEVVISYHRYVARTKDEVSAELRERLRQVSTDTPISYSQQHPCADAREMMPLNWKIGGVEATVKMKSAALAHEKGHVLRPYRGDYYDKYFAEAFDWSTLRMTSEELALCRSLDKEGEKLSDMELMTDVLEYLTQACELAERMSQLKNYFGFRGNEPFTAEHLAYAREHYVQDTGLDNWMRIFLTAITPETEAAFLRIINEAGI